MRLIDADRLKEKVLKWLPSDPYGIEEKEHPIETDIVVSLMMEIEDAPTVGEWIPVNTLLPSRDGEYLVSSGGHIYIRYYGIPLMPMNELKRRRGWYEYTSEGDFYLDVDAWMPLPEPWKGADE